MATRKGGETVPEKYMDKLAKCPFYAYQDNKAHKVFCYGWLEGQHVSINFSDNQDYKLFREGYCCSIKGCEQCPTYQMLRKEAAEDEY